MHISQDYGRNQSLNIRRKLDFFNHFLLITLAPTTFKALNRFL